MNNHFNKTDPQEAIELPIGERAEFVQKANPDATADCQTDALGKQIANCDAEPAKLR
jgi:hypothetical protein